MPENSRIEDLERAEEIARHSHKIRSEAALNRRIAEDLKEVGAPQTEVEQNIATADERDHTADLRELSAELSINARKEIAEMPFDDVSMRLEGVQQQLTDNLKRTTALSISYANQENIEAKQHELFVERLRLKKLEDCLKARIEAGH
jgi:hypothetical protein